jgi:hypothetical protein
MRNVYVIGRFVTGDNRRSDATYYVEGFGISPTWTYRSGANQYTSKRQAIREAKSVVGPGYTAFVEPYHNPFGNVQPVWCKAVES